MSIASRVVLGLFLVAFRCTGIVIVALGMTTLLMYFVLSNLIGVGDSPTSQAVGALALKFGITFLLTGVAVHVLLGSPRWLLPQENTRAGQKPEAIDGWLAILAFSLAVLPLVALAVALPLLSLWREALGLLDSSGFWNFLKKNLNDTSGAVWLLIMPVAGLLLVPLFQLATVLSFLCSSAVSLILLNSRRREFPVIFLACVLTQFAFLAGSYFADDLITSLKPVVTREFGDALSTTQDPTMAGVTAWMQRQDQVVGPTAQRFAWLFLGYLVWAPVL